MKKYLVISLLLGMVYLITNCSSFADQGVNVALTPHEKLSDYQFFIGKLADLQVNERVLPYDLNSPLFSDYAHKARFIWMPEGTSATYTTDEVLDFPKGTVLIKNFYYENDETDATQGKRILETRLLINRKKEWEAIGYIWNDEQTEAYLEVVGDIKNVEWVNTQGEIQTVKYIIPNKNQCKNCHAREDKQIPIGPKVRNLNKTFAYREGSMNQLEKWSSLGYLTGYVGNETHPKLAVWDQEDGGSLHERALAYLDVNCGHCHNPKGAANTSGLSLTANSELDLSLGIYKATVSAGAGTGGHTYSIVPGKPNESILVYRMNSLEPAAMMPELGRRSVHKEGVALISEWISAMEVEAVH